jgi:FtsP/CotA-like multicopper oxidase with cupredoxin domain
MSVTKMPHLSAKSASTFKLRALYASMFASAKPVMWGLMGMSAAALAGPGFVDIGNGIKSPTYYANSPAGAMVWNSTGQTSGTALRKFVNKLPGVGAGAANDLGQYITLAVPEKWVTPGGTTTNDDYYELGVVEFTEKLASAKWLATPGNNGVALYYPDGSPIYQRDAAGQFVLDATGAKIQVRAVSAPHALGPLIQARSGTAVRLKVTNLLPVGRAETVNGVFKRNGDLFLPVDKTLVGTGVGPDGKTFYTENRASVHLHGGDTPWISDGTPYQWFAPAGEADTSIATSVGSDLAKNGSPLPVAHFLKGASAQNVPDMPDPGPGALTFYYPNNQSARMLWYHDHTIGLTRVNVAAGMAAPYVIADGKEDALINSGALPAEMIPLVFQDKTFVPDDIALQDANWNTTAWGRPGDFWFPHVYETNGTTNLRNNGATAAAAAIDADPVLLGANPAGRWDFGPEVGLTGTFPSLMTGKYGPPVVDTATGMINAPSTTPEAFMDTPLVNGTAYPSLDVQPKAYRFRMLNATNDRFLNLSLFEAVAGSAVDANGNPLLNSAGQPVGGSEVAMVPAQIPTVTVTDASGLTTNAPMPQCTGVPDPVTGLPTMLDATGAQVCWPASWPLGGMDINGNIVGPDPLKLGGVPDPTKAGPKIVQVGNETGWLPNARHIAAAPALYAASQTAGDGSSLNNVSSHALQMTPAERNDVIIDFSQYAGKTLILYNDAPAPFPGFDDRYDYFTGNADLSGAGGAESTKPGYGPNTRTIMQIKVAAAPSVTAADGTVSTPTPAPFDYTKTDVALPDAFAARNEPPLVNVTDAVAALRTLRNVTGLPAEVLGATGSSTMTINIVDKAIVEEFDPNFGRLNAIFGIVTQAGSRSLAYADRPTEFMRDGETTLWRITHTGVDTHPVHFHLVNVQIVARVNADGSVEAPATEELGWKETVVMNPAQDIIVAFRPTKPVLNGFTVPSSSRMLDPSQPAGVTSGFTQMDPVSGQLAATPVVNAPADFSWEYVWHCHILGHEENDFMRVVSFIPNETTPLAASVTAAALQTTMPVSLSFVDNASNEYAYRIERADASASVPVFSTVATLLAKTGTGESSTWADTTAVTGQLYSYKISAVGSLTLRDAAGVSTGLQESLGSTTVNVSTAVAPADPSALATSLVTANSLTLSWAASANATAYKVEQNLNGVWTTLNAAVPTTTLAVAALLPASNYQFRVTALNGQVTSAGSVSVTVRTLASLLAPTFGAASSVVTDAVAGAASVTLNWTNTSTGQTLYKVERFTGTLANSARATAVWTPLNLALPATGLVPAALMGYTDTTAAVGTAYVYRLTAVDTVPTVATVGLPGSQAVTSATSVAAPILNTATSAGATVTLGWTDNSTNETGFQIYRALQGTAFNAVPLATVTRTATLSAASGGAVTFADATAMVGNVYTYRIVAVNTVGVAPAQTVSVSQPSNELSVSVDLAAPTNLSALAGVATATATPVTLSFTDMSVGETGFEVYRWDANNTAPVLLATVARTAAQGTSVNAAVTYSDITTVPGLQYFYKVRAVSMVAPATAPTAVSADSAPASVTVKIAAPSSLSLASGTATATTLPIVLSWIDNSSNETRFVIERSADVTTFDSSTGTGSSNTVPFTPLALSVARNATASAAVAGAVSFTDGTAALPMVTAGTVTTTTVYTYRVVAQRVVGAATYASQPSNEVITTAVLAAGAPSALSANTANGTSVVLSWIDNSTTETSFSIERAVVPTATNGLTGLTFAAIGSTPARSNAQRTGRGTAVTFTDATAAIATAYEYRVVAVIPAPGVNMSSASTSAVLALNAPSNVTVAQVPTGLQVAWTDNSNNETGFEVVRTDDTGMQLVTAVASTATQKTTVGGIARTWIDTTAIAGVNYSYVVRAVNLTGAVTTKSADSTPMVYASRKVADPSAPLAAITSARSITVTWTDLSTAETGFVVERAFTPVGGTAGVFTTLATVARTAAQTTQTNVAVSYIDTLAVAPALAAQGSYQYRVTAVNQVAGVTKGQSGAISGNVLDFMAPAAPASVTAIPVTGTPGAITVNWTDSASTETGFSLQYSTSPLFTTQTTRVIAGANPGVNGSMSYTLSGLVTGTPYYVGVASSNLVGLSTYTGFATAVIAP